LIVAGLVYAGLNFFWLLMLGLIGCAGVYLVLRWHTSLKQSETYAILQ
jgi:hypothetical protein